MNPYSPIYFIRENWKRCLILIIMMTLGYGIYLGGLLITNPMDNWKCPLDYYNRSLVVRQRDVEMSLDDLEEALKKEPVTAIQVSANQGLEWTTIMGFQSGWYSYTFKSKEDFILYCDQMGITYDESCIKPGTAIFSELMAKNRGLEVGDIIDSDYEDRILDSYRLVYLTDEKGYVSYFIEGEEPIAPSQLVIFGEQGKQEDLVQIVQEYEKDYVEEDLGARLEEQFAVFFIIYGFIVILLAIIMAVTMNAAFVGMYQKREFEFAVYRAIGRSKWSMLKKLAGELLLMDVVALVGGGAICGLFLYLLNEIVLVTSGLYLRYVHPVAVAGLVLANIIVVVPLIINRGWKMVRTDICEY